MPQRTITIPLPRFPDTPVLLELLEPFNATDGVYLPRDYTGTTDSAGSATVTVDTPNNGGGAALYALGCDGRRRLAVIPIPYGATTSLIPLIPND